MSIKYRLYFILAIVFVVLIDNISFAANLNEPPDAVSGSWGMIIFVFIIFVFIIPAIIDFKQKRNK